MQVTGTEMKGTLAARWHLGFGMMRLPVLQGEPTNFDYAQLNRMVDKFLAEGFTYFDTSYVYHNGKSEEATRKAVVERYPRTAFTVATKFPTFGITSEDEVEPIFAQQLKNLGVDYIDYYLLHNIQTVYYDGIDGQGGIVKKAHLFEHAKQWQAQGKIKHLGFSFHSSAQLLDRVLTEHPEVEFVQIALNYVDWHSELVQAKECYEVIRKHGRKVIIMETVKGGGLAKLPPAAEKLLLDRQPQQSISSWALRFAANLEGVLAVLSGMSTLAQVEDNCRVMKTAAPLAADEEKLLWQAETLYRASGPLGTADLRKYAGLKYHGVPVSAILQAWNICQIQPNPGFSDDNNYYKNAVAAALHADIHGQLPAEKVILQDGTDITDQVRTAEKWLIAHTF